MAKTKKKVKKSQKKSSKKASTGKKATKKTPKKAAKKEPKPEVATRKRGRQPDDRETKTGRLLTVARKRLGFTGEQLAAKLGISQPQVSVMERGESFPVSHNILGMCAILRLDPLAVLKAIEEDYEG